MKKFEAKLEVIRFDSEDTIATSGPKCGEYYHGMVGVDDPVVPPE